MKALLPSLAIEALPEVKADLAARLAEFERDPEAAYSWDQVKEKLKTGSWRTAKGYPVGPFVRLAKPTNGMRRKTKAWVRNMKRRRVAIEVH